MGSRRHEVKLPTAGASHAGELLHAHTQPSGVMQHVEPGHRVLIHAAAGGVGQILSQWAKHLGATVIGTTGSEEKAAVARARIAA